MTFDPSLPGADLVQRGLDGLRRGEDSDEALLLRLASTRLRQLGVEVPALAASAEEPSAEHRLYLRLLARLGRAAGHLAYNDLVARLVSFEDALAGERARQERRRAQLGPDSNDDQVRQVP